jgi:hypothetical protein
VIRTRLQRIEQSFFVSYASLDSISRFFPPRLCLDKCMSKRRQGPTHRTEKMIPLSVLYINSTEIASVRDWCETKREKRTRMSHTSFYSIEVVVYTSCEQVKQESLHW